MSVAAGTSPTSARAGAHPLVLPRCPAAERPLAARLRLARGGGSRLVVGRACWLAEDAWPGNFAPITLGDRVCLSQGAVLCTGNHNFRSPGFDLRLGPISIGTGAWIAARAARAVVALGRDRARQPGGGGGAAVAGDSSPAVRQSAPPHALPAVAAADRGRAGRGRAGRAQAPLQDYRMIHPIKNRMIP
ncbi:MAG: hypothetical protein VKM34_05895 [Cyanobacteriota bacterium]|nr:hypothetical protein [Cyanobacteriota bacterium]